MKLFINDHIEEFKKDKLTIKELTELKNIPENGTAVAVNDRLIKRDDWTTTILTDNDSVTLISAAFGG